MRPVPDAQLRVSFYLDLNSFETLRTALRAAHRTVSDKVLPPIGLHVGPVRDRRCGGLHQIFFCFGIPGVLRTHIRYIFLRRFFRDGRFFRVFFLNRCRLFFCRSFHSRCRLFCKLFHGRSGLLFACSRLLFGNHFLCFRFRKNILAVLLCRYENRISRQTDQEDCRRHFCQHSLIFHCFTPFRMRFLFILTCLPAFFQFFALFISVISSVYKTPEPFTQRIPGKAQREGFEPPWGCPQTVFKTASL